MTSFAWLARTLPTLALGASLLACSKGEAPSQQVATANAPPSVDAPAPGDAPQADAAKPKRARKPAERVVFDGINLPTSRSELTVKWALPSGTALNHEAPLRIRWNTSEALTEAPEDVVAKGKDHGEGFLIALEPTEGAREAKLIGEVELVVCDDVTHAVCLPVRREVELSFVVGGKSKPSGSVTLQLPAARS